MPNPSAPRPLVRAADRGAPFDAGGHPYNPRAEPRGWPLSRLTGLTRIAVNLISLRPGKESAEYHLHHREEEWVFVVAGAGALDLDGATHGIGPGDFAAFPPGVAHLLRNTGGEDLLALVGGEVFSDVDVADFPRLGRRLVRMGRRVAVYPLDAEVPFLPAGEIPAALVGAQPPRPERVLVRAGERPPARTFHHPQNPAGEVAVSWLSRPALRRISAGIATVPAGREAYTRHVHRRDEEWMFVLSGRGVALLGDAREEVVPGDFLGFPPGGEAHSLVAGEGGPLVYLQGGDAWSRETVEIVDFPGPGLRKTFVGTRSAMTFPLAADVEPRR